MSLRYFSHSVSNSSGCRANIVSLLFVLGNFGVLCTADENEAQAKESTTSEVKKEAPYNYRFSKLVTFLFVFINMGRSSSSGVSFGEGTGFLLPAWLLFVLFAVFLIAFAFMVKKLMAIADERNKEKKGKDKKKDKKVYLSFLFSFNCLTSQARIAQRRVRKDSLRFWKVACDGFSILQHEDSLDLGQEFAIHLIQQ